MRNRALIILLATTCALAGCTSTLRPAQLGADGRFATGSAVDPRKITINGPFVAAEHARMAVVLDFTENNQIKDFYFQSISNSGVFQQTFSETTLERYLLENNVENVTDTSSLLSLRNLARARGNFLIIKPYIEAGMGYQVSSSLEVYDAASGTMLFRAEKQVTNWAGLDGPLFYPLFNSLIEWTRGEAVSAPPEVVTPAN